MQETNKNFYIKNVSIYCPNKLINNGIVLIKNGVIHRISSAHEIEDERDSDFVEIDGKGFSLMPGLIDIHANGGGGSMSIDGNEESIENIIKAHSEHGTTGILLTTISVDKSVLFSSIKSIISVLNRKTRVGSCILGIHLEGPFLNPDKRGAHQKQNLELPNKLFLEELGDTLKYVKVLSLAPELEGADELIDELIRKEIVVGFAHSNADFSVTKKAIDRGVSLCAHIFNGMQPLTHKEPGPVGAFLTSPDSYIELISDGVHVAPSVMEIVYKSSSSQKLILVTDSVSPAGTDIKEFEILGTKLEVKDNSCYLPSSDMLAGSALTMNKALQVFVENTSCGLIEAVNMASLNPAKLLKIDSKKGSLEVGKDADLILMDDLFNVQMTMVEGSIVFQNELIV